MGAGTATVVIVDLVLAPTAHDAMGVYQRESQMGVDDLSCDQIDYGTKDVGKRT